MWSFHSFQFILDIRNAGQQISDNDRGKIDKKLNCDFLIVEPMQTRCGHFMCKSCVEGLIKGNFVFGIFFSLNNSRRSFDENRLLKSKTSDFVECTLCCTLHSRVLIEKK